MKKLPESSAQQRRFSRDKFLWA